MGEVDNISFVQANTRHSAVGTESLEKPVHPWVEVEKVEDVKRHEGDVHQLPHSGPLHLFHQLRGSVPQQANSAVDPLPGEGSQDQGVDREDGEADEEEGNDNQPEELAEEFEVGLAVFDKSSVRVEDDQGAEDQVEDHGDEVDLRHHVPDQDERGTGQDSIFKVLTSKHHQPDVAEDGHWTT